MSGFHALFSIGGLAGAMILTLFLRAGLGVVGSAALVAAMLLLVALSHRSSLLDDRHTSADVSFAIVPQPRVLLLGMLCFISFLAEGAVLDWSAVFLREHAGMDRSLAGVGYAVFSVAMVAGRLTGDGLSHRFGDRRLLRTGGAVAALGFLILAAVPSRTAALGGLLLVGVGASNIVPLLFSASGRVPGVPPSLALATVTTIAYAGLLVGPALVGFVADATSLRIALAVVAGMLAIIPIATRFLDAAPAQPLSH
jgi:predicted MFS family arabinose efflux permease